MKTKKLLTKKGLDDLQKEYGKLVNEDRPEVIKELKRSRELGDLSENGAYTAAREKQAFVEGRIKEIEDLLKDIEVVSGSRSDIVSLGSEVELEHKGKKIKFFIVGHGESDYINNKIAHDSPLGEAICGKKKGDRVIVKAPAGDIEYTIVSVS